ncbi:hypothetical protein, partial [Spiroplasma sp. hyd1]|uniref:hypothetical protein n=1 Tax=Spiroplasma sp. hyd1 TaxID=1609976 RepID=UPI0018DC6248
MKKLLSLLSVLTIMGTAMPNVIATSFNKKDNKNNILLINNEKYKNDFFLSDKNIFNENTRNIFIDKEDNKTLYFMNFNNNYLKEIYLLSENKVVTLFVKEIENKKFTDFIKVNNKFYFCGDTGIYEFKKTENNYIKINNGDGAYQLNIDNKNNIYYLTNNLLEIKKLEVNNNNSISVVKNNEAISYFSFDKNNNLYYASKLNIFKKNS